jgi:hypothetical protein
MEVLAPLPSATKDRAARPGLSGIHGWAILAVLLAALGVGIYGLTASHGRTIGYVKPQPTVDQTLVGTVAHPALTIEGDYVRAHASTFSVLALVNGPVVPGEGLPFQANYTTCTWTISLSHVVGKVPISVGDFDSIDAHGVVYKPQLVPGQAKLPKVLLPGHSLTFKVRAVTPVGEGLMRWAPDGNHIIAKWDYQVEND